MNKVDRNDPCLCGSGKKYKLCCLKRDEALAASKRAEGISIPKSLQFALEHLQTGRLSQAEALYQQILQIEPNNLEALHYLGIIAYQSGKYEIAVEIIGKTILANPSNPTCYVNLGNALKGQGNLDEAARQYLKALSLQPNYAEVHYNLGNTFQAQGKLDAAVESFQKALLLKPNYADALYNLGNAFREQGKLDQAVEHYHKALSLKPDYAEAHSNLGFALQELGRPEEAIEHFRTSLSYKSDIAETHNNLGNTFRLLGKSEEAINSFNKTLSINPEYADAYAGLAIVHSDLGQFEEAQIDISKALEFQPGHPIAWSLLSGLRKMTLEDTEWLNIALGSLSKVSPTISAQEKIALNFAIGKYYDDTRQYDLAFAAYQQGNRLKRQREGTFNRDAFSRAVDAFVANYSADVVSQIWDGANLSERPVLIVGMPRSGTSLIEQIIASHPDGFGAGELTFWNSQAKANKESFMSGKFEPALIAGVASAYEQLLQQYSAEALRIVDKMPGNFYWLGLIKVIFPKAKIIHSQRNPIDTCLSIYFNNFASSHSYGTDLDDLAFYYREYTRLMHHWKTVLPSDQFLEVPYEALVDDQASWSQRIIEFIGLDWDERCLDFHKTERRVGTASNWQVRQKIYSTSKARWHNYENHLGPLLGLI